MEDTMAKKMSKESGFEDLVARKLMAGIVTPEALIRTEKLIDPTNHESMTHFLKVVEPCFFTGMIDKVKKEREWLRSLGLTGSVLDKVSDAISEATVRGFLIHRSAVSIYDEAKLTEMCGKSVEEYEDALIDAALAAKKKEKKEDKKVNKIEVSPEKKKNLEDLVD